MIQKLIINGLYKLYNYELNIGNKDLFIITGPNGFGKTTILRIIDHLHKGDFWYFYFLVFESITILTDNNCAASITKVKINDSKEEAPKDFRSTVVIKTEDGTITEFSIDEEYIRQLRRMMFPYNMRNVNDIATEDILEHHYKFNDDELLYNQYPDIVKYVNSHKCLMIEEQRLIDKHADTELPSTRTVEEIQVKLKEYLQEARNTYNKVSQQVDSTFIERLSNKKEISKYKGTNNKKLFEEVKKYVDLYKQYGLIDDLNIVGELGVQYAEVLRLYLLDMKKKLDATRQYYSKLELFGRLVTTKQLSNKKLMFRGDGLSIESKTGHPIPLQKLSSGEQNLIILCYKLVFELDNVGLLLIDEPENSMHMAWLQKLLDDYKDVAANSGCQMIIATHSPAFIHGQWKLTYDLCEHGTIL